MRYGDPGLFVCTIGDGDGGAEPAGRADRGQADRPRPGVWLVLAICPLCSYRSGRYCLSHDVVPTAAFAARWGSRSGTPR